MMTALHDLSEGNHWVTLTEDLTAFFFSFWTSLGFSSVSVTRRFLSIVSSHEQRFQHESGKRLDAAAAVCSVGPARGMPWEQTWEERCQKQEQLLMPTRHFKASKLWWAAHPTGDGKICVLSLSPCQSRDDYGSQPYNSTASHFTNVQVQRRVAKYT